METNKTDTFNKIVSDHSSCPICFEEFKLPKSLPSCCHSYCDGCLEKMLRRPNVTIPHPHILCPMCQKVSPVPEGIASLPVNPILIALLEHTPAAETRKELYRFLDNCSTELSKSSSQIKTIVRKVDSFKQHVETQKELVSLTAGILKEEIDKKANKIFQELDIQAARLDEWTEEYQLREDKCSDTMEEYKRYKTLIKNESADLIVNKKMIYLQQLEDLKANACKRATKLLEEANLRIGNNAKWPRFIANEELTEALEEYKIGYLDGDENIEKGCEEFNDLLEEQKKRPQAAGNSHIVEKITYTREFLLQLRFHPVSLQVPEGLPDFLFTPRRRIYNRIQSPSWTQPLFCDNMYDFGV